jgi:hypothetical protein
MRRQTKQSSRKTQNIKHRNAPMPSRPPTAAQINSQQKVDAEQATLALQARQNEARNRALAVSPSAAMAPAPVTSPEAFEQNLQEWGSGRGTPLTPNGLDGGYQSSAGEKVDVAGITFAGHLDETRREWIKFNGEGNPPTLVSVGIDEAATFPAREELGDMDESRWEKSRFTSEAVDPWQEQFRVPIVATDAGGAVYELTSRSATSKNAIRSLIDRYGRHPQRRKGLIPLITLSTGTYHNKKLGQDKPKPVYTIVGWIEKDGSAPAKKPDQVTSGLDDFAKPFKDSIPF